MRNLIAAVTESMPSAGTPGGRPLLGSCSFEPAEAQHLRLVRLQVQEDAARWVHGQRTSAFASSSRSTFSSTAGTLGRHNPAAAPATQPVRIRGPGAPGDPRRRRWPALAILAERHSEQQTAVVSRPEWATSS